MIYSKVGNNFSLLERLIKEFKVDVNEEINGSTIALIYCITPLESKYTDINTLKLLLDNKANINYTDNYGNNILNYCKNFEKFEILFNYNANINLIDNDGKAFIHRLAKFESYDDVKILKFLIDKKVDLNGKTKDGKDIFDLVDKNENPKIYELLMKYKNTCNKENRKSKNKKNNITKNQNGIKKQKKITKKGTDKNNRVFHITTSFHL